MKPATPLSGRKKEISTDKTTKGQFITTEPLGKSGEAAEKQVWEAIQVAFKERECLGYWRYPIFSQVGQYRREPDILIADRQLGLIIIEVKALNIEQIVRISGHCWEYQNFYTTKGNPYQQAEQQLYTLLEYSDREPSLNGQVTGRALVALPLIRESQWQERGFQQLPSSPPILHQDLLQPETRQLLHQLIAKIPPLTPSNHLSTEQWQLLLATLAGTPLYGQPTHRVLTAETSKGSILQQIRTSKGILDWEQERIAKQIPPGPQRLRGVAGSGKSVLLCQKAAHFHLKYPHWQIALVFFSRSLYYPIVAQVDRWLRYFSCNQVSYDPQNYNLRVLHAWGSRQQPGLYSVLCRQTGIPPLAVTDTRSRQPQEALAEACTDLLQQAAIPQLFDAILIDEGQDLLVEPEYKYQHKQPFYWLAYQALHPANPAQPEQKRLIWADDEAQSLTSLRVANAQELFGEELAHLVAGEYSGGMAKTALLRRSYRTPESILTVAQALSMGFLKPGGMVTGMSSLADWQALGYRSQVTNSSLGRGKVLTIERLEDNSPHPLPQLWTGEIIEFQIHRDRNSELAALSQNLFYNLRYDGLRPSRELLVIILGSGLEAIKLEKTVAQFLIAQGLDIYIPSTSTHNQLRSDKSNSQPNQFWYEGAITISRIHRAKGQEADLVYLVGLEQIAKEEHNLSLRNQLLVALTRTRGWVHLSGIGDYPLYEELHSIIHKGTSFSFRQDRPPQRQISLTPAGEVLQSYGQGSRNFQNAHLLGAQLPGVNLSKANLIGANLKGANLEGATLDGAKLAIANLAEANLSGASLRKAQLMGANLQEAKLRDADLQFADVTDAFLEGADLKGTLLEQNEI
ncbi:MAG: pentapeptide repeat-containing protein [Spirulinaceae cyanobacterium]